MADVADVAGKERKSIGRKLIFSLLPLAIGWLLMEGLVLAYFMLIPSSSGDEPHMLYVPHTYRSYQLAPNITDLPGQASHNAFRFRGRDFPERKPPATIRVVCLGGSTTYNTGATTDSHTYPAQLGAMLRAHYSTMPLAIEVINAGHPAYTSLETLILFQTRILDFSPDVAVFHHGLNDTWEGTQIPNFSSDYTHARRTFLPPEVRAWEYSPLLTLLFRKVTSPYNPYAPNRAVELVKLIHSPYDDPSKLPPEKQEERLRRCTDTLERNVMTFLSLARGNGAIPVISTMTSRSVGNLYDRTLSAWNERLRVIAKREAVALVDFARELPWNARSYYDTIHLRDWPEGLERKARIFADVLIRERIVERVAERMTQPAAPQPRETPRDLW